MTDRIDHENWPTPRGPWHEVTDISRIYDHGRTWCANAAGHPGDDGYPDPERHQPWHECRSPEVALDDALLGIDGAPTELTVYLAAPFRFGQLRSAAHHAPIRTVIDAWQPASGNSVRVSVSLGEALRLARLLNHLVDSVSIPFGSGPMSQ